MCAAVDVTETAAACDQVTKNLEEIRNGLIDLARTQADLRGKRNALDHVGSGSDARERNIVQDMKGQFTRILTKMQREVNSSINAINKF